MMKPSISVIIPCFNAGAWIKDALESVISQRVEDIEIIAVDDGSTDNTADIIEKEYPLVKLVKTNRQGASRARNLGTSLCRGEFIQYLDADDLLAPGKLILQRDLLNNSGADVAYGAWSRLVENKDGRYVEREKIEARIVDPEIDLFTDFWSPPAAYLFRRSIVEKTNGWNENLSVIQDARFVLDCALAQAVFVYSEGLMAFYRQHNARSLSSNDPVAFVQDCLRNAVEIEQIWRKHGGINNKRKAALLKVYGYIAREGYVRDIHTFTSAYRAMNDLVPLYRMCRLTALKFSQRLIGHHKSKAALARYRQLRSILARRIKFY